MVNDSPLTNWQDNPAHLVSSSAHSDDLMRLHGVHAVCHYLVAMGPSGGDDASVARYLLHLDSKRAQSQHAPHGSAQVGVRSHLKQMMIVEWILIVGGVMSEYIFFGLLSSSLLWWYLVVVERLVNDARDRLAFVRDTDQYSHIVQEPWRFK